VSLKFMEKDKLQCSLALLDEVGTVASTELDISKIVAAPGSWIN
jgi:hypothetical protein